MILRSHAYSSLTPTKSFGLVAGLLCSLSSNVAWGQDLVTFDGVAAGQTVIEIDVDSDLSADIIFTSLNGSPFGVGNVGSMQVYIDEPGLTSTATTGPEIRVDFPHQLTGDFALDFSTSWGCGTTTGAPDPNLNVTIELFVDGNATPVESTQIAAECLAPAGSSEFAEGRIQLSAGSVVDYALVNLADNTPEPNLMIDNVSGQFTGPVLGNRPRSIPTLPVFAQAALMLATALLGARFARRRSKPSNA